jgi:hypothetical protein
VLGAFLLQMAEIPFESSIIVQQPQETRQAFIKLMRNE